MKNLVFSLALLLAMPCMAELVPDPAAKALGAVDTPTYSLYQRLVGSSWNYAYGGKSFVLTFEQGGKVTMQWWPGATWRITGPNSIAIKNPQVGEMAVHFSPEFKKFVAKDWSGGNATGTLRNPDAKVRP